MQSSKSMRRSSSWSMDSIISRSGAPTPTSRITPSRSRSRSLTQEANFAKADAQTKKNMKPPQDKETLDEMTYRVLQFLDRCKYHNLRTINNLAKITAAEYFNLCKFTLQRIMGKGFLAAVKPVDLPIRIFDIAEAIGIQWAFNKSYLKTPTTPFQWAASLSFLYWLIYKAECALHPINFERPLAFIVNQEEHIRNLAKNAKLELFFQHVSTGYYDLNDQLARNRRNIMEAYGFDGNLTTEELEIQRDELESELLAQQNRTNPTMSFQHRIDETVKRIYEMDGNKEELQDYYDKCSDVRKLHQRAHELRTAIGEMDAKLLDFAEVTLSSGLVITDEAGEFDQNQIEYSKQEGEAIDKHNEKIARRINMREQQLKNLHNTFIMTRGRLDVCEDFNALIRKLELLIKFKRVDKFPGPPFTPKEFKPWLEVAVKIKESAKSKIHDLDESLIKQQEDEEQECIDYDRMREDIGKNVIDGEFESLELEKELEEEIQKLQNEFDAVLHEISRTSEEMSMVSKEASNTDEQIEKFQKKISKIEARQDAVTSDFERSAEEVEEKGLNLLETELLIKDELRKREVFYADRWNEIFFNAAMEE